MSITRAAGFPFRRYAFPLAILLLSEGAARAGTGRWTSIGPDGAMATALAVSGNGVAYAGLLSNPVSVVASSGRLTTWRRADGGIPPRQAVFQIVADPSDPSTLYLVDGPRNVFALGSTAASNGPPTLYRSRDSGATWAPLLENVRSVAAGQSGGSTVLYAVVDVALWKSMDRGETWTNLALRTFGVRVCRTHPEVVVAEDRRSTDGGLTWTQLALTPLAVDPVDPAILYARDPQTDGVLRSEDGGVHWNPGGGGPYNPRLIEVDPRDTVRVWVSAVNGLFRSDDRGASWTSATPPKAGSITGVAFDSRAGRVFVADLSLGVFWSADGSNTWQRARGLRRGPASSFAAGPGASGPLYIASNGCGGISRSADGGRSWCCLGSPGDRVIAVHPDDPRIVYGFGTDPTGQSGFGRSIDGAETWSTFPPGGLDDVQSITTDPTDARVLYATGSSSSPNVTGTIFRTDDAGATWNALLQVPFPNVSPMAVDPARPSTLYVAAANCPDVSAAGICLGSTGKIYRSSDSGDTWTSIDPAAELGGYPFLGIPTWDPGAIYLVGDVSLQVSRDGGVTFRRLRDSLYPLVFDSAHPGVMYGLDGRTAWRSADAGETWTSLGTTAEDDSLRSLVLDRTGSVLRASTSTAGIVEYQIPSGRVTLSPSPDDEFEVSVTAEDPATGRRLPAVGASHSSGAAVFHFPDLTGDAENPEVSVKILDGRGTNGRFWVFQGGLTSVPYTVSVREISTGIVRTYPSDGAGCGSADAAAFSSTGSSSPNAPFSTCGTEGDDELDLDPGHEFTVTLSARDPRTGSEVAGAAVRESDRFGTFSLPLVTGDTSNPEVLVKILDGRAINGRFWVFYATLTDFEYAITVTDRQTGRTRRYTKAAGTACGGIDTDTFAD